MDQVARESVDASGDSSPLASTDATLASHDPLIGSASRPRMTAAPPGRRSFVTPGAVLVAPAIIAFTTFLVLPLISVFLISALKWTGFRLGDWTFVGADNYTRLLGDPVFWKAFANTIVFTIATTLILNVVGFGLALLIASRVRGHTVARSVIFIPVLMSPVIIGLMWGRILDAFGAINQLISIFNPLAQPILFLGSSDLALPSIIVATIWQYAGYDMLLYYAGLQKLPTDQLEAASLDGAGHRASVRHVILPSLYPVVGTVILLNVIGGLRVFDIVYVMTRGGPDRASEVMATYMYESAFRLSDMGYASAVAVGIVLISIGAAVARLRLGGLR